MKLEEMQPLFDEVAETIDFLELMTGKLRDNYALSAMAKTCELRKTAPAGFAVGPELFQMKLPVYRR